MLFIIDNKTNRSIKIRTNEQVAIIKYGFMIKKLRNYPVK